MELGDLEVEILHILGTLGESRPHEIHRRLQRTHPVAYTTVTNTLYRLVEKNLVHVRRIGPKRAYYARSDNEGVQANAAERILSRLVRAFGPDAVSRLMDEEASPSSKKPHRRKQRSA